MALPTPEDTGFLSKLVGGLSAAVLALSTWAWAHTHKRIDQKADKDAFDKLSNHVESHTISNGAFMEHVKSDERQLASIRDEIETQRDHIGKVFDRMTKMDEESHRRHIELLTAIHKRPK